ncbi:hypothetical protein Ciccas_006584, partial [Cichlidogyrus casuarinus]
MNVSATLNQVRLEETQGPGKYTGRKFSLSGGGGINELKRYHPRLSHHHKLDNHEHPDR